LRAAATNAGMRYTTSVQWHAILRPAERVVLGAVASERGLCRLSFGEANSQSGGSHELLTRAALQLEEYFAGSRRVFDLPLDLQGTAFQLRVWNALLQIPYGETRSYAEIARAVGAPKAVRAVGAANGANPVGIIVPCHRVIGSNGGLTGFGGGLDLKRRLLALESGLLQYSFGELK
jgi:O-6-methylguanine DNA methyltransferase